MNDPFSSYLDGYLRSAYAAPLLAREEEQELVSRMQAGGAAGARARDKLVTAHLKMVVPVARKFLGYGVPLDDLIQEGNLGLIRAAEKFDLSAGTRFSTYAWFWVRAAIKDYACDNSSTVRIPATKRKLLAGLKKALRVLADSQEAPTEERLAALMKVSVKDIRELSEYALIEVSLNTRVGESGETELGDLMEDGSFERFHERLESDDTARAIRASLDVLNERERIIVSGRFGLDGDPQTLEDLAQQFKLTRERIRQIEAKALQKLGRVAGVQAVR